MAVYKPTYCYPYLEAVDLTIPDGEKYFTCQIDTSNIKITGYRVELYNENNERIFPQNNSNKISPLSELNDVDGTLGLNGSELRFPFVQHWNPKTYPSYNAIYFKATNYVDYYQKTNGSIVLERAQIKNGCLNDKNGNPIFIDGSLLFVDDIFILVNKLYKVTLDGVVEDLSLGTNAIIYVKGGDTNAGSILSYNGSEFVDASGSAWCDIAGNPLAISNNGKTYKWQITLYSGERGAIRTTGANGAIEISYDLMADNEFNTVLTSGTILGSTADRIQGPISDKIYAKQWLQLGHLYLDDKGNSKFKQVGIRTYIESYSQSLGCIYPISGDSRGFSNDNLYPTDGSQAATHFAVYKYSNDPNSITSQNSVDQSVNFALTEQGMTYNAGSYSYEIVGRDKIDAFNDYCKGKNPEKAATTPLCDYNYNEDDDTYEALHAGESVLIWNKENSKSNDLTGYFTISFSTSKGEDGKKIPKFVFDMAYAYRKVSSYIGKVFFVKGGSFANENIVSKAEATGVNDVVSLGDPITFTEEEPLEIYPDAPDAIGKLYGEIYKNSVKDRIGIVYVSPFVGLQAGARLYVSDGTVIKAQTVDTTTWAVTYAATAPASTSAYPSTNPSKYEIRTNFKSSDETPFYAYDTPRLVPWSEQALSVIGTNGYEFLLEFMGQILTVPTIFSSEIHARYVHVTGQYLQAQNVSWTSYRWLLVDEYGQVIQDTGKQYDGLIETTFYGLNGPKVSDVEAGNAVPTTYYPVLIVEDELGNSLIMGMKIEVSLNPRNLPMEFSGSFDCKTQSVVMKIKDYGYPKFSQDSNNKATVLDAEQGVNYPTEAEIASEKKFVSITGENKSLKAADQVKIPTQGAQLKHFFAKDTTEIPDLSKAPKKLATNNKGNIEFHTKVKLDANFCGEILKYSVDIFDTFGNTDKLNILLELPNNFGPHGLNDERNKVKCTVSTKDSSASASGIALFDLPSGNQEAYCLQPADWTDPDSGDLTTNGNSNLEYLDFAHPFVKQVNGEAFSYVEQKDYTNINEPINTKAKRDNIGECCLQVDGGNYFNKWTDLKRIQVETPAGYRVVQTAEPAKWQDTGKDVDGSTVPMIWTEGKSAADTNMVQVKRHAKVAEFTWEINGYLREIDALYGQSLKMATPSNGVWEVYKETQYKDSELTRGEKPYVIIQMNKEVAQ